MVKGLIGAALVQMLIISSTALAETKSFPVKGMHCSDCAEKIREKVCTLENVTKCDVEVGKVTLTTKDDSKIDDKAVTTAVEKAGYTIAHGDHGDEKSESVAVKCDHKDGKSCAAGNCGCGEKCGCDHANGGCNCEHKHDGHDHKKHKKAKKKGA